LYDVIIIGAGPMGCKVGELLGKDYKILIIDKKTEIGKPVQCSGFNSKRIFDLSGVSKKVVLNKVTKSKFFSPNGTCMDLKSKIPFYVLDRELFDKELAKKAEKNNAEIMLKTEFKAFEREKDFLNIETSKGFFKTKLLIGADGSGSTVARVSNLPKPDNLLIGIQETIKGDFDLDCSELWFGSKVSPDFFGWVIPEGDDYARIGLASSVKSGYYYQKFVEKRIGKITRKKDKVAGLIRFGLIKNSVTDRVLLVGDAACQVKPYSGGGLIYGLIAAKIASKACENALKKEKYDYNFLKRNYDDKWKEKLKWPIIKGLVISKMVHSSDRLADFGFGAGKYLSPIVERLFDEDML